MCCGDGPAYKALTPWATEADRPANEVRTEGQPGGTAVTGGWTGRTGRSTGTSRPHKKEAPPTHTWRGLTLLAGRYLQVRAVPKLSRPRRAARTAPPCRPRRAGRGRSGRRAPR